MPKKNKKQKQVKSKNKIKKQSKKNKLQGVNNYDKELSLEEQSLLDFKASKSFSVATSISEYKSKSLIGDIYDYKPLHDKINNICINKVITKEPSLNKKISKELCECIFDKNKNLSIRELESRLSTKKDIPSINCIKLYDNYIQKTKKNDSKTSKASKASKTSKTSKAKSKK